MKPIDLLDAQASLRTFADHPVYLHLETTNGAYASHNDESFFSAGAFIRNVAITFEEGKIIGDGPYRVGVRMANGWVYAEGITHYEIDEYGRLLMAGLDHQGRLAVAFELSNNPFDK